MTLIGWAAAIFPAAHVALILASLIWLIQAPDVLKLCAVLAIVYLLPPVLFRLYSAVYPARAGRWLLNSADRCDWWVAHQLQMTYAAVPVFEALLRLLPGVYSAWLRLWGSKIGKRVYWTVLVEVIDRHMLRVGDDVVIGHRVICSSHAIRKKPNGDLVLILRTTRIGSGSFIGAFARIGPGVQIPESTIIPYNAEHRFSYAE